MTGNAGFLLLKGDDVFELLQGQEQAILEAVRSAYIAHREGQSCLPHSSFVRFPGKDRERIIALPGYLGGDHEVAGLKWIASFPGNLERGLERASAQLTLNATDTGYPIAYMESSIISAKRTAASAALAAHYLRDSDPVRTVALVGCGPINYETLRFLLAARPELASVRVFDLSSERAAQFVSKAKQMGPELGFVICDTLSDSFVGSDVIALATTAVKPYIEELPMCDPRTVVLHTSLRDLMPRVVLAADNLVDDFDHALRAQTSLHLAEQEVNHRAFVRCEIADVFTKKQPPRVDSSKLRIFSPFGLGVLDLAVGKLAYDRALSLNKGLLIESFEPRPWFEREEQAIAPISRP